MKLALITAMFAFLVVAAGANAQDDAWDAWPSGLHPCGNWTHENWTHGYDWNGTWNGTWPENYIWGSLHNETWCQIDIMGTSHGAEVRLLQLQKSIERNIIYGENIVEWIGDVNSSYNTSAMESLIDELKEIRDEVASVNLSEDTEELVRQFVDLKGDAINVTAEFRELAHDFMKETEAGWPDWNLNKTEKEVDVWMKAFNKRLNQSIRDHNAEVVRVKLSDMQNGSLDLFYKVKNGDLTPEEANDQLRSMLLNMSTDRRNHAVMNMAKKKASMSVKVHSAAEKAKEKQMERLFERLTKRLDKMEQKSEKLSERIESIQQRWNMTGDWEDDDENDSSGRPGYTGHAVRGWERR
ncbi:MAG: hypothetical protein V1813_03355 [Candidatus Aenigmatarchaeota archaeon]